MRFSQYLALAFLLSTAAHAQAPTDKVAITVTRAELQVIGQGLMELPYKTVAPVMNNLQAQLNAADQVAAKAAADVAKPADKPAEPAKAEEPAK